MTWLQFIRKLETLQREGRQAEAVKLCREYYNWGPCVDRQTQP